MTTSGCKRAARAMPCGVRRSKAWVDQFGNYRRDLAGRGSRGIERKRRIPSLDLLAPYQVGEDRLLDERNDVVSQKPVPAELQRGLLWSIELVPWTPPNCLREPQRKTTEQLNGNPAERPSGKHSFDENRRDDP
jgi:hypothetical protein